MKKLGKNKLLIMVCVVALGIAMVGVANAATTGDNHPMNEEEMNSIMQDAGASDDVQKDSETTEEDTEKSKGTSEDAGEKDSDNSIEMQPQMNTETRQKNAGENVREGNHMSVEEMNQVHEGNHMSTEEMNQVHEENHMNSEEQQVQNMNQAHSSGMGMNR